MLNSQRNMIDAIIDSISRYCKRQSDRVEKTEKISAYKSYKLDLLEEFEKRLSKSLRSKPNYI